MGNTIRREPVNFSIPASPDYKFLNITNFRGLDVSSNPFELATNTASDCLNVYVDETNTLTTRPRLEKKELKDGSGKDILPLTGRCVGTYPLHDGYLFHYTHQMKVLHGDKLTEVMVENTPQRECKCFEQGNKIYLLGDNRYMVIDENGVLKDVEGYVPNKSIVRLDGTVEKDEQLNLLSDVYTEKLYWDGVSKLDKSDPAILSVENNYYKVEHELPNKFVPFICYDDYSALGYTYTYGESTDNNVTIYYVVFKPNEKVQVFDTGLSLRLYYIQNSLYPMTLSKGFWIHGTTQIKKYMLKDDNTFDSNEATTSFTIGKLFVAPNGQYAIVEDNNFKRYFIDSSLQEYRNTELDGGNLALTDTLILKQTNNDSGGFVLWKSSAVKNATFVKIDEKTEDYTVSGVSITPDNSVLIMNSTQTYITDPIEIASYTGLSPSTFRISTTNIPSEVTLSKDGLLYGTTPKNYEPSKLFIVPDYTNPSEYIVFENDDAYFGPSDYASYNNYLYNVLYSNVFKNKYVVFSNAYGDDVRTKIFIFNNDKEPLITVRKKLIKTDKEYDEHEKNKHKLLSSTLFTRFDNNYWFASGNTCFWSKNNDPTYFPITEYGELGDSNEDITGFNVANDTTLLAYKPNRLFLMQPYNLEITGTVEYSKTESKNTVGNTAIDAPIVTTLTEIPIQINYDGIYGLSQVSNVSAVERIADLMSEPINDRWLNEDDEVIKKAQTLNRLYWTYIILPYTKESKVDSRDVCKVYLLDNRTNSWYYWELPIKLLNAFAKDNRAEFVDADGNIYYLTTTDIRNMGFDTQLVTEYYDYDKKLIPWYWQSQVLYLGTMNYAKRLVNTTFILTDTDTQDGYGLQYSFKVFRKLASSVPEKELSGELNLVRSTTKKTNLSKFGFLQLKLSNITEESQGTEAEKAYRNNKLRLVGLGLKYVLLEGLIR